MAGRIFRLPQVSIKHIQPLKLFLILYSFDGKRTSVFYNETINNHYISALGVYGGNPVAIAGTDNPTVEQLNQYDDEGWVEIGIIPSESNLYYHTTVTMNNILYTFGM